MAHKALLVRLIMDIRGPVVLGCESEAAPAC